jgi:hypothetical protein
MTRFGLIHAIKSHASTLIKYPLVNALRGVPMPTFTGEEAQVEIARQLLVPGSLIARIGETEGRAIRYYLRHRIARIEPLPYPATVREAMKQGAGFFPTDDLTLDRFARLYLAALPDISLYAAWTPHDRDLCRAVTARRVRLFDLDPFFTHNRWTFALTGRRVTIVSPFAMTIERQYQHRTALFPTPTLPDFELATVASPMTHVGVDVSHQDWFDNLARLDDAVAATRADVVVIGAGAYGFPAAAMAARRGTSALVMGGATQLLFGIAGQRWLNDPAYRAIMTPAWTTPSLDERPDGYGDLEIAGGAYW